MTILPTAMRQRDDRGVEQQPADADAADPADAAAERLGIVGRAVAGRAGAAAAGGGWSASGWVEATKT